MTSLAAKLETRLDALDWLRLNAELLENGFAIAPRLLSSEECAEMRALFAQDDLYRSTIDMKKHGYGKGSYRYFKYPLPQIVQTLRERLYEKTAASANAWAERLKQNVSYPPTFAEFREIMLARGQNRSTPLVLKYVEGDFNCLHQDIANDLVFPYQAVFGLSEHGSDYAGGQLVLTQQRPRQQTVPHVITIPRGGAVFFASSLHPQLGKRGYHQTVFRHGVGKVESGERYTMGIVFHDYREKPEATQTSQV